jgi:diacylglycerol kinase family enzyme
MKCLLLINASSGNSTGIAEEELIKVLEGLYGDVEKKVYDVDTPLDIGEVSEGFDAVAVCGGDGTFNYAVNALRGKQRDLIFVPCGTFNDCAHTLKSVNGGKGVYTLDIGELNGRLFNYVAAAGSFTPIGYKPKPKYKKIFKRLVYYFYAFKEYKVYRMKARLNIDGEQEEGCYTLIMAVNSRYVFGFHFNRLYKPDDGNAQLLLIRSPEGPFRLIKMFLRFFRAFFIGFDAPYENKNIVFRSFRHCRIESENPIEFCVDGELVSGVKNGSILIHKQKGKVILLG